MLRYDETNLAYICLYLEGLQLTIILIHKTTKFRICILYYFSKDAETIFNTLSPFLLLSKLSNVNKWPWGQKYCGLELSSSCGIGLKGVSINWSVLYFIIFIPIFLLLMTNHLVWQYFILTILLQLYQTHPIP